MARIPDWHLELVDDETGEVVKTFTVRPGSIATAAPRRTVSLTLSTLSDEDPLRGALLTHHPIMRSETGLFSGCRCGQVRLGEDVITHVVERLNAALRGEAS